MISAIVEKIWEVIVTFELELAIGGALVTLIIVAIILG
jgi:hypothetical protein